jgi:hypothetical protein
VQLSVPGAYYNRILVVWSVGCVLVVWGSCPCGVRFALMAGCTVIFSRLKWSVTLELVG